MGKRRTFSLPNIELLSFEFPQLFIAFLGMQPNVQDTDDDEKQQQPRILQWQMFTKKYCY